MFFFLQVFFAVFFEMLQTAPRTKIIVSILVTGSHMCASVIHPHIESRTLTWLSACDHAMHLLPATENDLQHLRLDCRDWPWSPYSFHLRQYRAESSL